MENSRPDYIKIFSDIISNKYPERRKEFESYLAKDILSIIDIITLNNRIFGVDNKETLDFNQKHKSYDTETILMILNYQDKHNLNNGELANHFRLSRNTVAKWKKLYSKAK